MATGGGGRDSILVYALSSLHDDITNNSTMSRIIYFNRDDCERNIGPWFKSPKPGYILF
jgi:hypothetical protein